MFVPKQYITKIFYYIYQPVVIEPFWGYFALGQNYLNHIWRYFAAKQSSWCKVIILNTLACFYCFPERKCICSDLPRRYQRKLGSRKHVDHTEETLQKEEIREGEISRRKAEQKKIPGRTIVNKRKTTCIYFWWRTTICWMYNIFGRVWLSCRYKENATYY